MEETKEIFREWGRGRTVVFLVRRAVMGELILFFKMSFLKALILILIFKHVPFFTCIPLLMLLRFFILSLHMYSASFFLISSFPYPPNS